MIRIAKPEPCDQAWKDWCAAAEAARAVMVMNFVPGTKPVIDKNLYKAQKAALLKLFNEKCAFCETPISTGMHGDVEHFRPKGAVTEEDGSIAKYVDDEGVEREHPGYYWLAYDWRNLLPSCQLCNQPSAGGGGKRNYFPLKKPADGSKPFRAHRPGDEAKEEPVFVHPWFEDPAKHFSFDRTGAIIGRHESAEKCIERLVLNREALLTARQQAYKDASDKYLAYIGKATADVVSLQELRTEILGWQEGKRPYSAPARTAIAEETAISFQRIEFLGVP